MPSFWRGVCVLSSVLSRTVCEKLSEFLAEARRLLALLPTPLLLRFLSVEAPLSVRPWGLPFPLRFSPLAAWSVVLMGAGAFGLDSGEGDLPSVLDSLSTLDPGELEPPPNILFSRLPPCEERLRRLLPASLRSWE